MVECIDTAANDANLSSQTGATDAPKENKKMTFAANTNSAAHLTPRQWAELHPMRHPVLVHISGKLQEKIDAHPEFTIWDNAETIQTINRYLSVADVRACLVYLRRNEANKPKGTDAEMDKMQREEQARMGRKMRAASRKGLL